ncbi:MAG: hypothetical protein ACM3O4_00240 [Ignavibacteriales bacterium]
MNSTDQNGMNVFNFKPEDNRPTKIEIIGAEPTTNVRVPDNFNDQKYIINNEPAKPYVAPTVTPVAVDDSETQVLYQSTTSGQDFNEVALSTLQGMLDKLKQAPISAREDLYENIGLWFENTYVDEESDEGFKIIDYDTYVEMLKLLVDAEKYINE